MTARELDLDLNRMRADVLLRIRQCIRELDDLDATERVLNGHTEVLATTPAVVPANGASGPTATKLLPEAPKKRGRKPKKLRGSMDQLMQQILSVLASEKSRGPFQMQELMRLIRKLLPPPHAGVSTMCRALVMLIKERRIEKLKPPGQKYPAYAIARVPPKEPLQKHRDRGRGKAAKPNSLNHESLRIVVEHPDGITIDEIRHILDQEGKVQYLAGYAPGTQIAWALKNHRARNRVTTLSINGVRIHKPILPKINVTKG